MIDQTKADLTTFLDLREQDRKASIPTNAGSADTFYNNLRTENYERFLGLRDAIVDHDQQNHRSDLSGIFTVPSIEAQQAKTPSREALAAASMTALTTRIAKLEDRIAALESRAQ